MIAKSFWILQLLYGEYVLTGQLPLRPIPKGDLFLQVLHYGIVLAAD